MDTTLCLAAKAAKVGTDIRQYAIGVVAIRFDGSVVITRNAPARDHSPSLHAEARALKRAGMGAKLFVARMSTTGKMALAKPCKECQKLIRSMRCKSVLYTVDNEHWNSLEIY